MGIYEAKEIRPNITPAILAELLGCSEDMGQQLINRARRNYYRGMYAPQLRSQTTETKLLVWDPTTDTATLETY